MRPIFFIGAPRSGTTVVFEDFARSASLGWLSNYSELWPGWPSLNLLCPLLDNRLMNLRGNKKQYGTVVPGNRYLPQPVEAYNFWDMYTHRDFSRSYLHGVSATPHEAYRVRRQIERVMRYQFKRHFVTKLTGPARIGYLSSIFDDAIFVHVVRDGRAVVHSLLNVRFWKEKGGFEGPFWKGGLKQHDIDYWHETGNDPAALCALQWKRIVELTREEASRIESNRFVTVKYEDYASDPGEVMGSIYKFTGIAETDEKKSRSFNAGPMTNYNLKYLDELQSSTISRITDIMRPELAAHHYLD